MAQPYLAMLSQMIVSLELPISKSVVLECKHFFSGAALYADGQICASLTPAGFGLKLPKEVRDRMIDEGEGEELKYFENAPVKREYISLSQAKMEDQKIFTSLLTQSIEYVRERGHAT